MSTNVFLKIKTIIYYVVLNVVFIILGSFL